MNELPDLSEQELVQMDGGLMLADVGSWIGAGIGGSLGATAGLVGAGAGAIAGAAFGYAVGDAIAIRLGWANSFNP